MAGSYAHIVDKDNNFIGIELIDNLGDAWEALEECYNMIQYLTGGDRNKLAEAVNSATHSNYTAETYLDWKE